MVSNNPKALGIFLLIVLQTVILSEPVDPEEYEYEKQHSSLSILEKELLLISNGETTLKLSVGLLKDLVQKTTIDKIQAKDIWKAVHKAKNFDNVDHASESSVQNPLLDTGENVSQEEEEREKGTKGFSQMMVIMIVGYLIVGILVGGVLILLYSKENYKLLFALLMFLSYHMLFLAKSLQDSMEAHFLSAIIYNTIFLSWLLLFHLILLAINFQQSLRNEQIFNMDLNRKGKICFTLFGLGLAYVFSFSCLSPVVQIPFYLFLLYGINLLRKICIHKIPQNLEPNFLFCYSFFALFLFLYLYFMGSNSFHEGIFFLKAFLPIDFLVVSSNSLSEIDFRFFGYLISILLMNTALPIYLFIKNRKLYNAEFNSEALLVKIQEEIMKEKIEFDGSSVYLLIYGILVVFNIIFALREKFILGTFFSIMCLVNILRMTLRNESTIGFCISFLGGFFLLTSIHCTSLIEDKFSPMLLSDIKDGYIIYFADLLIKIVFHYFSIEIFSAFSYKLMGGKTPENENENEEELDPENFSPLKMLKSFGSHLINYIFVVFFLAISEEESSNILSFLCVIFAFLLFLKLLIYSYTTKEETNRIIVVVFIYLAGIRFSMLSFGNLNLPLYLGNLLSNFCVCASYMTITTLKYQYINIGLILGLFIQSFAVNSSFGLIVAIINIFIFVTFILNQNHKDKRNGVLFFLGIITLMLWALSGFNLNAFFNIIEFVMKLLPSTICNWLFRIFEPTLLPEQILMKGVLNMLKSILLSPEF